MKVRWTIPAAGQLEQCHEHIAESNPSAAEEVAQRIIDISEMLGKHPGAGRTGRVGGTREFPVPDTPFIVAYSVTAGTEWILAVYHRTRKWPERF